MLQHRAIRQLAIGLVVAIMGAMVWAGAAEAFWPFFRAKHKLRECRAELSTCEANSGGGVLRTGQTECWDAGGSPIACAGTGQDGDIQAGVVWPDPRFTNNGDGTVTDNLTGLVWLEDWDCFFGNWSAALAAVNALEDGTCGLTDGSAPEDWRLPNINELLTLVDREFFNPAVPNTAGTGKWTTDGEPFTTVQNLVHWSSTSVAHNKAAAWRVHFGTGDTSSGGKGSNAHFFGVR